MGYDIERFVGYVNKGLVCCICRDVLEDPLQAPCEHAFCTTCIQGWLVHCSNCPDDRQQLDPSNLQPLYRSEMVSRVEEAKHEMESRLDSQRWHMVQKESLLQNKIAELKSPMSQMMSDIHTLMATERQHRQELEQAALEKQELLELAKGLQKDCRLTRDSNKKAVNVRQRTRLDSVKQKPRAVTVI